MDAARAALADPAQTAATFSQQTKAALDSASAQSLEHGFSEEDTQAALFAVVAWVDELAMTQPWAGAAAWRMDPLQRQYFSTTRAGAEFFEKLDTLPDTSTDVREVYALVLLAGFNGRYSHRPPDELADYRAGVLNQVAQERSIATASESLFPQAGARAQAPAQGTRNIGPTYATFLLVFVPLVCLAILYIFLDHHVGELATDLLTPLTTYTKP
jgi:type VI secretion system protein ImpK